MSHTKFAVATKSAPVLDRPQIATGKDFAFRVDSNRFDEDYLPSEKTRVTTNFGNLARGANRQENLRKALRMIDNRFNALAHWDNPKGDRYSVELDIISAELVIDPEANSAAFPLIEMLSTTIVDHKTARRIAGVVGNNFSSYVRDYDFNVLLPAHDRNQTGSSTPPSFGDLHGKLFKAFVNSSAYTERFDKPPIICISASSSRTYHRTDNQHPILGVEYRQDDLSATDRYFSKMGLAVYCMRRYLSG